MPTIVLLATLSLARPAAAAESVTVETAHYVLVTDAPGVDASELAAVLEGAWDGFAEFFGAAPELKRGERLAVRFCETRASFEAAIRADGESPPEAGGYYAPGSRTAYLWRQPTRYYTRCLLIHEAAHQFHYLARAKNRSPGVEWYIEGIAETLARHRFDGEKTVIGVPALLSLEDIAGKALAEFAAGADLEEAGRSGRLSRPLSYALVRYLLAPERRKKFDRLRERFDAGRGGPELLFAMFGPAKKLTAAVRAHLEAEQEPLTPVFLEWEEIGEGRVRGHAGPGIVSYCTVKGGATRISADLELPDGEALAELNAGFVLSSAGRGECIVALVRGGRRVQVNRLSGGIWTTLIDAECPTPSRPGLLALSVRREESRAVVVVEGVEVGRIETPAPALGPALQGGVATFRNLAFE